MNLRIFAAQTSAQIRRNGYDDGDMLPWMDNDIMNSNNDDQGCSGRDDFRRRIGK